MDEDAVFWVEASRRRTWLTRVIHTPGRPPLPCGRCVAEERSRRPLKPASPLTGEVLGRSGTQSGETRPRRIFRNDRSRLEDKRFKRWQGDRVSMASWRYRGATVLQVTAWLACR